MEKRGVCVSPVTRLSLTVGIWRNSTNFIFTQIQILLTGALIQILFTQSDPVFLPVFRFTGTLRKEQKKVWFADSVQPKNESSSASTTPTHGDLIQTLTPAVAQMVSADLPVSFFPSLTRSISVFLSSFVDVEFLIEEMHRTKFRQGQRCPYFLKIIFTFRVILRWHTVCSVQHIQYNGHVQTMKTNIELWSIAQICYIFYFRFFSLM